jgi:hypothetical protein
LRLLKGLIFFGKRDLASGINLPERSEIWKTLPGSEFQQKARGAVQEDSARPASMPLTNVAPMSVASNDSIWMQFMAFALMHDAG